MKIKPAEFNLPGIASHLIAKEGKAKLWITSLEVINKRILVLTGNTK